MSVRDQFLQRSSRTNRRWEDRGPVPTGDGDRLDGLGAERCVVRRALPKDSAAAHLERYVANRRVGEPEFQREQGGTVRRDCWTLLDPPFDRLRAGSPGTPEWRVRKE